MKLLITGASGLYGSKLAELALKNGHEVFSVHSQHEAVHGVPVQLDITDKEKVAAEVAKFKPDAIVHAASMTDVDKCEQNKDLAQKINVEGTRNVVDAAKAVGTFILFISTDYVFDGEKGCYKETDQPSPMSFYAYTKLKAEEIVKDSGLSWCIVRPSVIYGVVPAAGKVNFALWIINKLRSGEQAKVFVDQWNSPTLNSSLAEMTLEAAERRLTGIFHLSGASRVSRFDFAVQLARTLGLDEKLLVPSNMKDMSFPAKRPRDSSLDTSKAERTLEHKPLKIVDALARLKAELSKPSSS
jgi:dTDP-4-dehydrorhamnose reductase